ncbi:hypothetical protein [Catenuloplanes atrovinosus]|uniref:Uncharacterized protein n=1 Tax=Catenuloplanes atrovinosus TaxID=137266 RepID=A0AAE4CAR9_9ACTN|nr:hypothetical protein [Catenuloplanes atrovinosus]MDR7277332.1 hypothetical protein [Catenuloplanes atrovinosus]
MIASTIPGTPTLPAAERQALEELAAPALDCMVRAGAPARIVTDPAGRPLLETDRVGTADVTVLPPPMRAVCGCTPSPSSSTT